MSRLTRFAVFIFALVSLLTFVAPSIQALSGSDWRPGRIIDDSVFYNNNSMGVNDIQNWLNSQVPSCDTWGTKQYKDTGQTRAQVGAANGNPAPYVCLRDYIENPHTGQNNLRGGGFSGGWTAAQIIKHASDGYRINPQSLLVLLQKEQTLVTDDWPWLDQYRIATGYGCPDTAPICDAEYYGFFNQVMNAARQFRYYADNANQFRYKPFQNNTIYFNPGPSYLDSNGQKKYYGRYGDRPDIEYCGATSVYIENVATAGLYNYTPYQPNASALNNLYGSGDACGAYGNRNFWRLFNDWFGKTTGGCGSNEQPWAEIMRVYNPSTYKHFMSGYVCEINTLQAGGYHYEGVAFYQTSASSPYAVVVHRLYNPQTQRHLWATTQEDINNATQNAGYRYEGPAFYVVKPTVPGHTVVHRLYNPTTYQHLWATTQEDINNATQNAGFRYEGPAFYGAPPPR